jgi:hypothetical protein
MTDVLAFAAYWLSSCANTLGRPLLWPIGFLPGWLSATLVAAVTGVLLLVVFKFTSNQSAIKRVRNDINANLLALKLFKDSTRVTLRAQGHLLVGALRLFVLAVVPMLVMALPVTLLLGQLALWYQTRPFRPGEEAVITLKLAGDPASEWPSVGLRPTGAVDLMVGPVRIRSKREVCWNVRAREIGSHRLEFLVGTQTADKALAVGNGFMRTSKCRPGWSWSDIFLYPDEPPFRAESAVQSIDIAYPRRSGWTSGSDYWIIYWFAMSMVAAFCFRGFLNVNI